MVITIDKELMDEYERIYFKINPRCRVFPEPFKNPIPMSWNTFITKKRAQQNSIKGKYKDFAKWLAFKYKINNLNLDNVDVTYLFYFRTRAIRDCDNYTLSAKLINDGFTEAKVWIDDNSNCVGINFPRHRYDKEHPRLEMILEY